jgi:hypothetical protein
LIDAASIAREKVAETVAARATFVALLAGVRLPAVGAAGFELAVLKSSW